jgi:hypothetical protein
MYSLLLHTPLHECMLKKQLLGVCMLRLGPIFRCCHFLVELYCVLVGFVPELTLQRNSANY